MSEEPERSPEASELDQDSVAEQGVRPEVSAEKGSPEAGSAHVAIVQDHGGGPDHGGEPIVPMRPMRVISIGADPASEVAASAAESARGEGGQEAPALEALPQVLARSEEGPSLEVGNLADEEDLGEEEFEDDEATPALSEEDLEDSHSEEPPPVHLEEPESLAIPLVTKSLRPLPPVPAPQSGPARDAVAPPVSPSERKPPSPPQRSLKPALPSAKPRRKPWWEEVFGDDFSRAHKALSESQIARESDFITRTLELHKGSVVLDLCCGQGQHAIELSRRGFPVVGYDLSVFQLAVAADYAQAARQKINFLQGDMREMAFDAMFDAIVCWDTSFGYFEEEKNLDVIRRMFAALKPGGSLLLDIMNRDYAAREAPSNHWFEGDGCICMDDMSLDWITSRLKVKRSVILDDGRSKELTYSIRVYNLSEIGKLLHDVGFRVSSVSGHTSTPGAFLGSRSPRIIIRAQRPE